MLNRPACGYPTAHVLLQMHNVVGAVQCSFDTFRAYNIGFGVLQWPGIVAF